MYRLKKKFRNIFQLWFSIISIDQSKHNDVNSFHIHYTCSLIAGSTPVLVRFRSPKLDLIWFRSPKLDLVRFRSPKLDLVRFRSPKLDLVRFRSP